MLFMFLWFMKMFSCGIGVHSFFHCVIRCAVDADRVLLVCAKLFFAAGATALVNGHLPSVHKKIRPNAPDYAENPRIIVEKTLYLLRIYGIIINAYINMFDIYTSRRTASSDLRAAFQ